MPEVESVGRQPAVAKLTPSKPYPWYGTISGGDRSTGFVRGGEPFTGEQLRELDARRIDPRSVETVTVQRRASMAEAWWPSSSAAPLFRFACPLLGVQSDGRRRVIAPNGQVKLVQPDGWTSAPRGKGARA